MFTRITCFLTVSFLFIQLYTSVELSSGYWSGNLTKYSYFLDSERLRLREEARRMFYFGYDNYMKFAFPKDELDPIHCTGRGPDYDNPSNININDVLGDYSLGLLDSLSTLAIMGNSSEFKNAVRLVLDTVSFDKDNNVQVFEATIRVLGSLLSAHLIVKDPLQPFGDMVPEDYDDGLLLLAHDLAGRLLAAFDNATLGIPYPRLGCLGISNPFGNCLSDQLCNTDVFRVAKQMKRDQLDIVGEVCIKDDEGNLCLSDEQKKKAWKEHYEHLLNDEFPWNPEDLLVAEPVAGPLLVNLRKGVLPDCCTETCTAGAGTMLLEFGVLSRLLGDPTYEGVARRAVSALWKRRSPTTGLFGNVIDIHSGQWVGKMSGLGAGLDSFYEYLLKGYVMFGESDDLKKFNEIYRNIQQQMRVGRAKCQEGNGNSPILVNVDMETGKIANYWIDSLHAAFAGVQVLKGDIKEAICTHAFFYAIWKKYKSLPERFNWFKKQPEVHFYPLRPELIESTYLLYQATHHPFYLHVGKEILENLEKHARAKCGYATIHNVMDKTLEDRMESFFLSETCKYLYLLFDQENHVNQDASNYVFSTEGHIFRLDTQFRKKPWEITSSRAVKIAQRNSPVTVSPGRYNDSHWCDTFKKYRYQSLPLDPKYLQQVEVDVGLHD